MRDIYKAITELHCVAIRKKNWKKLMQDHPYFSNCLKIKILYMYDKHIRIPLINQKLIEIKKYEKRQDY